MDIISGIGPPVARRAGLTRLTPRDGLTAVLPLKATQR
jgi:hypothetical protein